MPVKRILVPIDGSEHSIKTLRHACDLATAFGAGIEVLQVIEPLVYPGVPAVTTEDFVHEVAEERFRPAQAVLEASQLPWQRRVEHGYAADRICAVAEDGFDLLVIGSHGASAVERFFFGSVASRVVQHAPCDVLVVR